VQVAGLMCDAISVGADGTVWVLGGKTVSRLVGQYTDTIYDANVDTQPGEAIAIAADDSSVPTPPTPPTPPHDTVWYVIRSDHPDGSYDYDAVSLDSTLPPPPREVAGPFADELHADLWITANSVPTHPQPDPQQPDPQQPDDD